MDNKEKIAKKIVKAIPLLSTDIFKGKEIPNFIRDHKMFKNPVKVQKIFPSIGIPNFKEKCNIDKPLFDVRKEGTFVYNLLALMLDLTVRARDDAQYHADRLQYYFSKEDREKNSTKISDLFNLVEIVKNTISQIDPNNNDVIRQVVLVADGKIALKLFKDVTDCDGKVVFRKGESLFKVFSKLRDKLTANAIEFTVLDQTPQFKTFSKENIPNKDYNIIFSSDGAEGAWDLLTMSMRGITSCQRWEGEYPRCLIGSVLSKFVGIIYLTSGVMNDGNDKNGNRANLGTKMMRRSVVRYAVDADEGKPCIIVDKMYPDVDDDVLNAFMNSLKSKTQLPVYYALRKDPNVPGGWGPDPKIRHIYVPLEKIREDIIERDWSYQDTPLKTKLDFEIFTLNDRKDETERNIKAFKFNLEMFIAKAFDDILLGTRSVDPEIKRTISNMSVNGCLSTFCQSMVTNVLANYRNPPPKNTFEGRTYYRKYIMEFIRRRNDIKKTSQSNVFEYVKNSTSRKVNMDMFYNYIFTLVWEFAKTEIRKQIN